MISFCGSRISTRAAAADKFIQSIFYDLKWLGLSWDEPSLAPVHPHGRLCRGAGEPEGARPGLSLFLHPRGDRRRDRPRRRGAALDNWGPSGPGPEGPIYPGTCRGLSPEEARQRIEAGENHALRLDVAKAAAQVGPLSFNEQGHRYPVDPFRFGDIVVARKDMPTSYHLAVVVDDAFQNVSLVTRGEDLLSATHIQRLLQALLRLPEPAYAHHPLVLDENGKKFSKRDGAVSLQSLRDEGLTPADIRARIGL